MSDLAEIRKRAMHDPQSLSKSEWNQIFDVAFTAPKKDFFDADKSKVDLPHSDQKKKEGWWQRKEFRR